MTLKLLFQLLYSNVFISLSLDLKVKIKNDGIP